MVPGCHEISVYFNANISVARAENAVRITCFSRVLTCKPRITKIHSFIVDGRNAAMSIYTALASRCSLQSVSPGCGLLLQSSSAWGRYLENAHIHPNSELLASPDDRGAE